MSIHTIWQQTSTWPWKDGVWEKIQQKFCLICRSHNMSFASQTYKKETLQYSIGNARIRDPLCPTHEQNILTWNDPSLASCSCFKMFFLWKESIHDGKDPSLYNFTWSFVWKFFMWMSLFNVKSVYKTFCWCSPVNLGWILTICNIIDML